MKKITMLAAACATAATLGAAGAQQISDGVVKIGVIEDMSGVYADISGEGSVAAVRLAIEDFGGKVLGKPIELLVGDHQNKADIGATIARNWFDSDRLDALMDVATSSPALAAIDIAKAKKKIILLSSPGSTRITNESCMPYSVHWTYDTYSTAHGTGLAMMKRGFDTWYFITADYAFGHGLEKDTGEVVKAMGGKVLGSVRHPINTADYSSMLLQAQASKAKVIGLANTGGDTVNTMKQAAEFGVISGGQRLAGLGSFINDFRGVSLDTAAGMVVTEAFYWDLNDETRAWSRRFREKTGKVANMLQAGVYSATRHYLKAVEAAGTDETEAVMAKMRETPVNDMFTKNGRIRPDGRMVHDMYLFEVKGAKESKGDWDYYKLVATIPADEAFQPLSDSRCALVTK